MLVFEPHALSYSIELLILLNFNVSLSLMYEKAPFDLFVPFRIWLWE